MSEVTKFDPSAYFDRVKERIKTDFHDLLPDDAFAQMVKGEIDSWLEKELKPVIRQELEKTVRARAQDVLNGPEFQQTWDERGRPVVAEAVQKAVTENFDQILRAAFGSMIQSAYDQIRFNLQSHPLFQGMQL